ncbi:MLO-like protein 6 [Primulina tabacum]|uniref:MLO-like protein 6 n=1 Tax=Primulina tabacum TaxID=48773 RepID=UPI003F5A43BA
MAGADGGRTLEQTPTWAVAVVCFFLVAISIVIEFFIHLIGKWLKSKHKMALYESLEKVKAELMLLGFISLLLTVGQNLIAEICISEEAAATWHPCSKRQESEKYPETLLDGNGRKLLTTVGGDDDGGNHRRFLASAKTDKCGAQGKVTFVSAYGIHQLHIFIFVLAIFHVLYCIVTLALGRLKMRRWKAWEKETKTAEYQFSNDPERFRFARETSFGRRHMSFWSKTPPSLWIVCFFRQFVRSVPKVDYLTLRHGFIMAHLAPHSQTNFDFQKYIKRSLEEDFKVVVGISPPIWFFAVLFLLFNTHGWYSYFWLPFIPLIIILLVGTKLQVIITKMGLSIQERGEVVKGVPVVQPGDDLFWFNHPRLILYLINFVLFQNAFQMAFFVWTTYEFGLRSCFHEHVEDIVIRISMGILIQILCSYVTLPLYALVTQMGSSMRPTIFNERIATALRNWHHTAKKHIKHNKHSTSVTPISSMPPTPSHGMSPVHLLRNHKSDMDSLQTSPHKPGYYLEHWDPEGSSSPTHFHKGDGSSAFQHHVELGHYVVQEEEINLDHGSSQVAPLPLSSNERVEVNFDGRKDFSFEKRTKA